MNSNGARLVLKSAMPALRAPYLMRPLFRPSAITSFGNASKVPSACLTNDLLSTAKKSLKLFTEYLSSDSFRRCSRFSALRACSSAMSGYSPAASSAHPSPTPEAQIGFVTKAWAAGAATTHAAAAPHAAASPQARRDSAAGGSSGASLLLRTLRATALHTTRLTIVLWNMVSRAANASF